MMKKMEEEKKFVEKVVQINRISQKTKGGDRFRFSALTVVGDKKGRVGVGLAKAPDVVSAIKKAIRQAKKKLHKISLEKTKNIKVSI